MLRIQSLWSLVPLLLLVGRLGSQSASSGTVPFVFDDNRVFTHLTFIRPDGSLRKALAFVDPGSSEPEISNALFEELQLNEHRPLTMQFGDMPVRLDSSHVT